MAKKYLVGFGINYPGTANALNGCINDLNWYSSLAKLKNFDLIEAYTNSQCTKAAMVQYLNDALHKTQTDDLFVYTYSGHGTIVPNCQSLVPGDFSFSNPNTWLTYNKLDEIFLPHEMRGVKIVAVHDSCHSSANPILGWRGVNPHPIKNRFIDPPKFIMERIVADPFDRNLLTSQKSILLLSGCQKSQTSADFYCTDDNTYHGAFSYYLEQAYKANPAMSYFDLVIQARALLAKNGFNQVPGADGDDSSKIRLFFE